MNDAPNLMKRSQWLFTARIALVVFAYFTVMVFANYLSRTTGGSWGS
jgi:hypothetical protein